MTAYGFNVEDNWKHPLYEQWEFSRVQGLMALEHHYFVFGSNEAGIHGAGAAKVAVQRYRAEFGKGWGFQGRSFAIPTKDKAIQTLPLDAVARYVRDFLKLAEENDDCMFAVTRIGCGLAGFTDEQIAPLFKGAPKNCLLPIGWREFNGEED